MRFRELIRREKVRHESSCSRRGC